MSKKTKTSEDITKDKELIKAFRKSIKEQEENQCVRCKRSKLFCQCAEDSMDWIRVLNTPLRIGV